MRIFPKSASHSMHMALRLCWMVSSIMSEEISGLLKMSENTNGIPLTKTGSISVSVSYTHLDVYKRQVLGNAFLIRLNTG